MKNKLWKLAKAMQKVCGTNGREDVFTVDETWEDYGAGMRWTTIIYHRYYTNQRGELKDSSHQCLYRRHMDLLKNADENFDYDALAREILCGEYANLYGLKEEEN